MRGRFYTVREQQELFDKMKPFNLFNSVVRQRIREKHTGLRLKR